jgi:adenylate kinase
MKIVILLGAPGSGKGTVAGRLVESDKSLRHVSSGDLLRGAVKDRTPAGVEAEGYMKRGELVPDGIIAQMIGDLLAASKGEDGTILLDGFPRNVPQAEILEKTVAGCGAEITAAVLLQVPDAELVDRIAGRRGCPKCGAGYHVKNLPPKVEGICDKCGTALVTRKDDNPATVKNRLEVYKEQTMPLIAFYRDKGILHMVKGTGAIGAIVGRVKAALA